MSILVLVSLGALVISAITLLWTWSLFLDLSRCEKSVDGLSWSLRDIAAALTKLTCELEAMKRPQEYPSMSLEKQRMLLLQEMNQQAETYWRLLQELRDLRRSESENTSCT